MSLLTLLVADYCLFSLPLIRQLTEVSLGRGASVEQIWFIPLIRQLAEDVFNVTCNYFSYRPQVETVFYYLNASGFWKRLKVVTASVKPYLFLRQP